MKLLIENIFTQIKKASKREIKIIDKALSYHVPNYQFMPAFKNHRWDGKKHFLNKRWNIFPTGLLVFVSKLIEKKHFKVKIKDNRKHLISKKKNIKKALKLLRPYQAPELKICLTNMLRGIPWFRGILKHPTGSGKTYMAAGLIKAIKCKTLVVVNGLELLYQTKAALENVLKKPIGVIGDQVWKPEEITVGMYQTLSFHILSKNTKKRKRARDFLNTIEALIIDECHHIDKKKSGYHVICDFCPAYYRFGFSASPLARRDLGDVQLIGDTGDVISRVDRKELEVDGWLAKPTIHVIDIDSPIIKSQVPFTSVYKKGITKNHERNDLIVQETSIAINVRKEKTLILVQQPSHGRRIRAMLRVEGIKTVLLHGGTSLKKRRRVIKETNKSSKPKCIIATRIFDEGVNIPDIRTLVIGGGGASTIKSIQRIGRGLRPKKGSNTLTVIEFYDMTHKFLEEHAEQRLAAYKQEGFEIVRQQ